MNIRGLRSLFCLAAAALLVMSAFSSGYSEVNPSPDFLLLFPLLFTTPVPGAGSSTLSLQPTIMLEVTSGCCILLKDELRMTVSGCSAPHSDGYRIGDTGVSYVTNSSQYLPHMRVSLKEAGCTLRSEGQLVYVTVKARASTGVGVIFEGGYSWTFTSNGKPSTSSPPPPAPPPPPSGPIISKINPETAEPGDFVTVSGTNFRSGSDAHPSKILFDYQPIQTAFVSLTGNLRFNVPTDADCGVHAVQVHNISSSGLGEYSGIFELTVVGCAEAPPPTKVIIPPRTVPLALDSLFPASGSPGTNVIVNGTGFVESDSYVYVDNDIVTATFISSTQMRFTVQPGTTCGNLSVQVKNGRPVVAFTETMTFLVTAPCTQAGGGNSPPPPSPPPPPDDEEPPPPSPPPGGGNNLEDYDTNNNCTIEDSEFFVAIDLWISGQIDNAIFFAVVDAWISSSSICSATLSARVTLRMAPHGLLVLSTNGDALGRFSIYDTHGRKVFASSGQRAQAFWNLRDARTGAPVANGVYYYVTSLQGIDGIVRMSGPKSLVVMR